MNDLDTRSGEYILKRVASYIAANCQAVPNAIDSLDILDRAYRRIMAPRFDVGRILTRFIKTGK